MAVVLDSRFDQNPTLPGVRDPYPIYRSVREQDPVHWCMEANLWAIMRYEDAQSILKDERLSRQAYLDSLEARTGPQPIIDMQRHELVFTDNPRHGQLRHLLGEAINARLMHDLQVEIDLLVDQAIAPLLGRASFDVIGDFALPLPTRVASAWLGVPEEDRDQIASWIFPLVSGRGVARDADTTVAANDAARSMHAYFSELIRTRRATPQDDLINGLLTAQASDPSLLTDDELIGVFIAVFAAGHGPGIAMLVNTLLALFQNPDQLALLRADPGLLVSTLEEGLRYDPPTQAPNPLAAREDIEIGGKIIRKGDAVTVIIGSTNRDPEAFPDPDRLDVTRNPNRHLAFSAGAHFCLGAVLARMEIQSALGALVQRLPQLRLGCEVEALQWIPHDRFRTLAALPVVT